MPIASPPRRRCSSSASPAPAVIKLLHGPTARLRSEQGGPLWDAAAELFGLEEALAAVEAAEPAAAAKVLSIAG